MANTSGAPIAVQSTWNEVKGKLKAKFPTLTEADLKFEEVRKEEMFKAIQTKLGITREELDKVIAKV